MFHINQIKRRPILLNLCGVCTNCFNRCGGANRVYNTSISASIDIEEQKKKPVKNCSQWQLNTGSLDHYCYALLTVLGRYALDMRFLK